MTNNKPLDPYPYYFKDDKKKKYFKTKKNILWINNGGLGIGKKICMYGVLFLWGT